jgi:peptide/nickel transport system permease protein
VSPRRHKLAFILQRIVQAVPVALLTSSAVFLLVRLIPGDSAQVLAGIDATPETVQAIRRGMGLDQPLPVQYGVWLGNLAHGDLGRSVLSKLPIWEVLSRRVPATIELTLGAMLICILVGIPTGMLAAVSHRKPLDVGISSLTGLLVAIPNFWFGILSIMIFALVLGWLPPGGRVEMSQDPLLALRALFLPALTLAIPSTVTLSRLVRASMLDVLSNDYVRTARAKGLSNSRVLWRHVLRNAMVPVVTVLGLQFGRLLGGSVVVESVFGWPGVGRLMLDSIGTRDYAVIQAGLLLMVLVFLTVNLLTDIACGYIDPRIRLSQRAVR